MAEIKRGNETETKKTHRKKYNIRQWCSFELLHLAITKTEKKVCVCDCENEVELSDNFHVPSVCHKLKLLLPDFFPFALVERALKFSEVYFYAYFQDVCFEVEGVKERARERMR